jgi:hypothetical protein
MAIFLTCRVVNTCHNDGSTFVRSRQENLTGARNFDSFLSIKQLLDKPEFICYTPYVFNQVLD